jgi:hypothetical protein
LYIGALPNKENENTIINEYDVFFLLGIVEYIMETFNEQKNRENRQNKKNRRMG